MRSLITVFILCVLSGAALAAETAAGLRWTAPAGWKAEGAQPMRVVTYSIAPAAGDTASGECGVYFFGAGQGGSVEANLERWKGQFKGPDGKPPVAKIDTRSAKGLKITRIDASGEYSGMGGPMAASRPVPGYRLLGGIVEGPGGNIFVKFTGPAKTVAANAAKFDQMLASFQPQ